MEKFLIDTGTIEPAEKFLQSTGTSYKLQWERNKNLMEFANRVLKEELMALGMMCEPHIPLLSGGSYVVGILLAFPRPRTDFVGKDADKPKLVKRPRVPWAPVDPADLQDSD